MARRIARSAIAACAVLAMSPHARGRAAGRGVLQGQDGHARHQLRRGRPQRYRRPAGRSASSPFHSRPSAHRRAKHAGCGRPGGGQSSVQRGAAGRLRARATRPQRRAERHSRRRERQVRSAEVHLARQPLELRQRGLSAVGQRLASGQDGRRHQQARHADPARRGQRRNQHADVAYRQGNAGAQRQGHSRLRERPGGLARDGSRRGRRSDDRVHVGHGGAPGEVGEQANSAAAAVRPRHPACAVFRTADRAGACPDAGSPRAGRIRRTAVPDLAALCGAAEPARRSCARAADRIRRDDPGRGLHRGRQEAQSSNSARATATRSWLFSGARLRCRKR